MCDQALELKNSFFILKPMMGLIVVMSLEVENYFRFFFLILKLPMDLVVVKLFLGCSFQYFFFPGAFVLVSLRTSKLPNLRKGIVFYVNKILYTGKGITFDNKIKP